MQRRQRGGTYNGYERSQTRRVAWSWSGVSPMRWPSRRVRSVAESSGLKRVSRSNPTLESFSGRSIYGVQAAAGNRCWSKETIITSLSRFDSSRRARWKRSPPRRAGLPGCAFCAIFEVDPLLCACGAEMNRLHYHGPDGRRSDPPASRKSCFQSRRSIPDAISS